MQQVLAKMVDTVAALLETFFGSQNNLSVQGLGDGKGHDGDPSARTGP